MHSTWTGGPPRKPSRTSWRRRSASGLNWRLWPTVMRRPTRCASVEQFVGLSRVHRERLLEIDVAAGLQTQPAQREVRLGGRGDVDGVHPAGTEHLRRVGEDVGDAEAIRELAGHQLVGVARRDQLAARQVAQLVRVLVGDHPAADDRHPGLPWFSHSSGTRSSAATPRPSARGTASRGVLSAFDSSRRFPSRRKRTCGG